MRRAPVLAFLLLAACTGKPEQPPPPKDYGAGLAPAQAAAPEPRPEPFVFPAERLAAVHAEMNAIAAQYGTQVELETVQRAAEGRLKSFLRGFSSHDARAMGLPEPERAPFTEEEKAARGPRAKWLGAEGWQYGDHLPRDGSQAAEGWTRLIGSRDMSTGYTLFIQLDVPQDTWVRMKWQPGRRRWSYFTGEEERAGILNLLASRYAAADPDSRNSARFTCERMKRAVDKAVAEGRDPSGFYGTMRGGILQAFDKDLEREALKYLAEEGVPAAPFR